MVLFVGWVEARDLLMSPSEMTSSSIIESRELVFDMPSRGFNGMIALVGEGAVAAEMNNCRSNRGSFTKNEHSLRGR